MVVFDVVEKILSRLPVKDLLLCKSVCKSWYSLISSPSFVKLQCNYICNNKDHDKRIAMITSYPQSCYNDWSIQGSSNGLVCIYARGYNRMFVTNPLTREFVKLSKPRVSPMTGSYNVRCLGFGYDSSTDDYKVVTAICINGYRAHVHILSLKSNIYKDFGEVNYRFHDAAPGILFDGAFHWFWFDCDDDDDDTTYKKVSIVSFDLAKEEFREIPQPEDTRYAWSLSNTLGIFEDRLCIFTRMLDDNNNPPFSIWVMKNCNVKPSWELLPITNSSGMKDHVIHYMLKDTNEYRSTPPPTYYCDDNIVLSASAEYIRSPIFNETLVSPYVISGSPSYATNNNNTVKAGSVKEKGETDEEENGSKGKRKIVEILPEEEGEGGKRTSQRISI